MWWLWWLIGTDVALVLFCAAPCYWYGVILLCCCNVLWFLLLQLLSFVVLSFVDIADLANLLDCNSSLCDTAVMSVWGVIAAGIKGFCLTEATWCWAAGSLPTWCCCCESAGLTYWVWTYSVFWGVPAAVLGWLRGVCCCPKLLVQCLELLMQSVTAVIICSAAVTSLNTAAVLL